MRLFAFAAASLALSGAPALAQSAPAPAVAPAPAAQAAGFTDAEVAAYAQVLARVIEINRSVDGQPTADQRAEMLAAVDASGLTVERYNAIAVAAEGDAELKARVAVAMAAPSAPGSVGASVTETEVEKFARAAVRVQAILAEVDGQPTTEQQTAMAEAVQESGLGVTRFNAIADARTTDEALRARIELAIVRVGDDAGA